jgi:hypothetical protein
MTRWQHERLHDDLDHEAFHDRLDHRAYHRHAYGNRFGYTYPSYSSYRTYYRRSPSYSPYRTYHRHYGTNVGFNGRRGGVSVYFGD